jgi:hypothetical protein
MIALHKNILFFYLLKLILIRLRFEKHKKDNIQFEWDKVSHFFKIFILSNFNSIFVFLIII